jgi:hypothetical protein
MISGVFKLIVVWVFSIVGIVIVIMGIIKSEIHKVDFKNLILTILLIILSINFTFEYFKKLK